MVGERFHGFAVLGGFGDGVHGLESLLVKGDENLPGVGNDVQADDAGGTFGGGRQERPREAPQKHRDLAPALLSGFLGLIAKNAEAANALRRSIKLAVPRSCPGFGRQEDEGWARAGAATQHFPSLPAAHHTTRVNGVGTFIRLDFFIQFG